MHNDELLTTTRSARKSLDLDAPIDLTTVQECLEVGLQAPNGSNQQCWRWILVRDPSVRSEIAALYKDAYYQLVGGIPLAAQMKPGDPNTRIMSSTEWLVEHLAMVPLLVLPCYRPYLARTDGDESFYQATIYGSIFPAVWNFQLALHTRGYGTCITTLHLHREGEIRRLLEIPDGFVQCCLLPVARLRSNHTFKPAPRRPIEEVTAFDRWSTR